MTIDIAAPAEVVFDTLADPAQRSTIDGSTTVRGDYAGVPKLAGLAQCVATTLLSLLLSALRCLIRPGPGR